MATSKAVGLPEGFVLDEPDIPKTSVLPEGFSLDAEPVTSSVGAMKSDVTKLKDPEKKLLVDTEDDGDGFDMTSPLGDIDTKEAYTKFRPALKATLEGAGLVAGGVAGTGAGPVGTVAGAGLGFAAGKEIVDVLDKHFGLTEEKPLSTELVQSGKDVAEGVALEAGGAVFGKAVQAVGQRAIPIAKRLYESALKPSTTLKPSVVDRRITTGLEEGVSVTQKGMKKNQQEIKEINNTVQSRIKEYAEAGQEVMLSKAVKPLDVLSKTEKATNITANQPLKRIAGFKEEVLKTNPDAISIEQAQIFKQTINKELDDFYKAINKGRTVPPKSILKAKAAMADGLRKEISSVFPEVTKLNAREGAKIELNKSLGRAVNRIRNREIIPLVVAIATGVAPAHSLWKAMLLKAIEHPAVKSKLAIALFSASKKPLAEVGKRTLQAGVVGSQANENQDENLQ